MSLEEVLDNPGVRWNRPAVVAIVVVLLAGLGAGAWALLRPPAGPLPPPEVPWPVAGEAYVFLCRSDDTFKNCGKHAITAAQRPALERALRALPEVSALRFVSRAETLKEMAEAWPNFPSMLSESDMPESFRVDLKTTGDFLRKVETLPGVSNVTVSGRSFWADKTDVIIQLCPPDPLERDKRCLGRGETSAAEKAAIYQALRTIDGVGAIYLEDRAHASRDTSWWSFAKPPNSPKPPAYISEHFHLVLDAPDAADRVRRTVGELPGVNSVEKENS
jgi:cell division protein FtsX